MAACICIKMILLIKKYKNRRLYNTEKSQYITLEDLQGYVLQGKTFRVEDTLTNKDITNMTLLQILVEMENSSTQLLSGEILRQLICLASHPMHQSLQSAIGSFFKSMQNTNFT